MTEGNITGDKYQIIRTIGSGGMSVVYLARDLTLRCEWAVKVVKKGMTAQEKWKEQQILREAMLMKRLNHPGFPRIVDLYREADCTCIVMDYIEGITLEQLLQKNGPLGEKEVLPLGRQLCDMLFYLHTMNPPVFYGDLKPANVICSSAGRLYLIDFGIAVTGKEKIRTGTPGFAAPEQLREGMFGVRTDIYSLGMTLYTLLTGLDPRSQPFRDVNQEESLQFPENVENSADGLQEIIRKCTDVNQANRYRNCRELMRDLLEPIRPEKLLRRRKIRNLTLSTSVIVIVLLIAAFSIFQRAVREFTEEEIYAAKLDPDQTRKAEEKEQSYLDAIELQPENSEGFLRLLTLYETEMEFGERESRQLMRQFHQNRTGLSADRDVWNEILCRIGRLYFFRFQGGDGSVRERILRAEPFFSEWEINAGEKTGSAEDAACLGEICRFYKTYTGTAAQMLDPSRETLLGMLRAIEELLAVLQDYEGDDQAAVRLTTLREMADFLNGWRYAFCAADLEQKSVEDSMRQIADAVQEVKTLRPDLLEEKKKLQNDCGMFIDQISDMQEGGD